LKKSKFSGIGSSRLKTKDSTEETMKPIIKTAFASAAACVLALLPLGAQAQSWPTKPVRIIVPYAPGGSADTLGRIAAEQLTEALGQQFVVENKPGAGGVLGSTQVARAAPDGYTLGVSGIATHVIAPAINPNVSYDPVKDFSHVALLGGPPIVFVVHPSVKANSIKEFEALVKGAGKKMSFGSPGAGTHGHLMAEAWLKKAGLEMEHIAYKGASGAMTDLIGNHIPSSSNTLATAAAHIRSGAARGIAVTSKERLKAFPDVPTFAEAGYPDLVGITWFSLSGPKGMPKDIVDKINKEVVRIMASPQVQARLARDEIVTEPLNPEDFTKFIQKEIELWTPVAKASGAQPE
jgi:tripartite-type tricarboxylate transporter receptor subunit TctC